MSGPNFGAGSLLLLNLRLHIAESPEPRPTAIERLARARRINGLAEGVADRATAVVSRQQPEWSPPGPPSQPKRLLALRNAQAATPWTIWR
jgi:hypothetical protein